MIETRLNLHFATERCEIKEILSFLQRNVYFKDHLRTDFFCRNFTHSDVKLSSKVSRGAQH